MDSYVKVANESDLGRGTAITVSVPELDRVDICLVNVDGEYHAFTNVCTHKGAPLAEGRVTRTHVVCPWHKASFSLAEGSNNFPAKTPLRVFDVKADNGSILIRKREK